MKNLDFLVNFLAGNSLKKIRARYFLKTSLDVFVLMACAPIAVYLRVGHIDAFGGNIFYEYMAIALAPKLLGLRLFNIHRQSWHDVSTGDLKKLIYAIGVAFFLTILIQIIVRPYFVIPFGIPFIDAAISIIALGGFRLAARGIAEDLVFRIQEAKGENKRVIIIGAGNAGTMIAREMLRNPENGLVPIAFIDDDKHKISKSFLDIPVIGTVESLEWAIEKYEPEVIVTAIPSDPEAIRKIIEITSKFKIRHQVLPRLTDLISGKVSISQIRDVDVEDLLQRKSVNLNISEISEYLTGKTVLVTGAGGSIGSEIVRQVCKFEPASIIILGRGQNSIYQIRQELNRYHSDISYVPVIADVRDKGTLERVFQKYSPEIIFHAAAHKHVPLMEENPEQAVLNNIFGTKNLVDLALEFNVSRFVNISTDKAVNPTSIMGASKRVAEYVVEYGAMRASENQYFVSVRFGNVLGSRGSVIPLFKNQIKAGGPVTVTDKEMTRYFMTIPEASQLVLQAGGMDNNGAVYVLDMGEPVKIVDLAKDLIRLSGYKPGIDIKIKFTGSRPGEKLFEEILTAEEGTFSSKYEKIFVARKKKLSIENLDLTLQALETASINGDETTIRRCLNDVVPNFSGFHQVKLQESYK